MIKKLILLLTCMVTCSVTCTFAANSLQVEKLFNEAKGLCSLYQKQCNFTVVNYEGMAAQTKYGGNIYISSGFVDKLTEAQLRSVLYHEVGHVVLEHIEKSAQYQYTCNYYNTCNQEAVSNIHRKYEYEADRFAVLVTKFTGKPEGLEGALKIITPPSDMNTTQTTHPSTSDRIRKIRRLYYGQIK